MNYDKRMHYIWTGMKQRCFNKNSPAYESYGGRGITVCQEWTNNYKTFEKWAMKNNYSDNLTIDRIDNDGNYEPNNCRWVTMREQSINKGLYKNNTTGVRGVYVHHGKYRAEIKLHGKTIILGSSDVLEEAATIRKQGEILYYGKVIK
jgi:hypothetical protein